MNNSQLHPISTIKISIRMKVITVWLTQEQMAIFPIPEFDRISDKFTNTYTINPNAALQLI